MPQDCQLLLCALLLFYIVKEISTRGACIAIADKLFALWSVHTSTARNDDWPRPRRCLEPLLHSQQGRRSNRPRSLPSYAEGDRKVVYRYSPCTRRDGGGNSFDLDQRAAAVAWPTAGNPHTDSRSRPYGLTAHSSGERRAWLTKSCGHHIGFKAGCSLSEVSQSCRLDSGKHLGPILQQMAEMTFKIKQYDQRIRLLTQTEYPRRKRC